MLAGGGGGGRWKRDGLELQLQPLEPQERSDYYFPELCLSRPYPDKTFAFVAAIVTVGGGQGDGQREKQGRGAAVWERGVTCYTCNLCNNASRVFAFAFSKIEAIGPYAYFRDPYYSSSTYAYAHLCSHSPLPLPCVSTAFLLGVLFLSSPVVLRRARRHGTKSRHL